MSIGKNIQRYRNIKGLTQEELGKAVGVSSMAVSQWENDRAVPRMGSIERLSNTLGVTKSQLLDDGDNGNLWHKVIPGAIKAVPGDFVEVPVIGKIHAGKPTEAESVEYAAVSIPKFLVDDDPDCYACISEGDCMNKVYPEGCIIIISPNKEPINGSVAVVSIDGNEAVMRKMYRTPNTLVLSPDSYNPENKDIVITSESNHTVEFIGKVVWFQSKEEME